MKAIFWPWTQIYCVFGPNAQFEGAVGPAEATYGGFGFQIVGQSGSDRRLTFYFKRGANALDAAILYLLY
jgi:hypothetical protein